MRRIGGRSFGAVNNVRNFMNLVREIDFDEVRQRAEQPPRVLVVAPTADAARTTADAIFGANAGRYVETRGADDGAAGQVDATRYDAVVVADPDGSGTVDQIRRQASRSDPGKVFPLTRAGDAGEVADLRGRLVGATLDMAPAYGRHFEEFRQVAVKEIVDDSARANAQFALVSNIPAIIPILGGFVSASADLIVLTKNQVMMSYKIAAVHGRDLHDQGAIIRELIPVVGAGFLWRSIAREATSFLPLAAGTIPKVAIAYAGTFSVGRAIDFYFRSGKTPSKHQMQAFLRQATETAGRIGLPTRAGDTETAPTPTPTREDDTEPINPS